MHPTKAEEVAVTKPDVSPGVAMARRWTSVGSVASAVGVAAVVVMTVVLTQSGRSPASGGTEGSLCLPSRLHVRPERVRAGGQLRVSSAPFACDASYPPGTSYRLILAQVGRAAPLPVAVVPVNGDGSFSAVVRIPASAPPGESYLVARGSAYDRPCQDTVRVAASCAGYAVRIDVRPARAAH